MICFVTCPQIIAKHSINCNIQLVKASLLLMDLFCSNR
uniref:Uncharacterized protein n=1 Tax=Arundo donax TaxID=35708 RepID=A0A0A9FFI7_ARUDO